MTNQRNDGPLWVERDVYPGATHPHVLWAYGLSTAVTNEQANAIDRQHGHDLPEDGES